MSLHLKENQLEHYEPLNEIEMIPVESMYSYDRFYLISKRILDIFGSIIGIIAFSFVFILITIAIKIESWKDPVFYTQTRVGKDGKLFSMYKFRSMKVGAESELVNLLNLNEVSGPMFKMKEDPRVTKVGKFIRSTSLDEIPQLFNVLKGEMSLVGPRPPLENEVANYTMHHRMRLKVVPGCTGVWQVSGRSELSFEEMIVLDLNYIQKQSIKYDVQIILKTFSIMFNRKGAY